MFANASCSVADVVELSFLQIVLAPKMIKPVVRIGSIAFVLCQDAGGPQLTAVVPAVDDAVAYQILCSFLENAPMFKTFAATFFDESCKENPSLYFG